MLLLALLSTLALASFPYTIDKKIASRSAKEYVVPRLNSRGLFQHEPSKLYYWGEVTDNADFTTISNQGRIDLYGLSYDDLYINTFSLLDGTFKVFDAANAGLLREFTFPGKCSQSRDKGALQLYGDDLDAGGGKLDYRAMVRYYDQLVLQQGPLDATTKPVLTRQLDIAPGSPADLAFQFVAYQDACTRDVFILTSLTSTPVKIPLPPNFGKLKKLFFASNNYLVLANSKDRVIVVGIRSVAPSEELFFSTVFDRRISVPTCDYQLGWRPLENKLAVLFSRTIGCQKTYYLDLYSPLETKISADDCEVVDETGVVHYQIATLNAKDSFWIKGVLDPAGSPVNIFALNRNPEQVRGTIYTSP